MDTSTNTHDNQQNLSADTQADTNVKQSDTLTDVYILGGKYTIKSGFDANFVQATAKLVNDRMTAIMQDGGAISTDKVAILGCMNIASELLKTREALDTLNRHTKKRLEKILKQLATSLGDVAENETQSNNDKQEDFTEKQDRSLG